MRCDAASKFRVDCRGMCRVSGTAMMRMSRTALGAIDIALAQECEVMGKGRKCRGAEQKLGGHDPVQPNPDSNVMLRQKIIAE